MKVADECITVKEYFNSTQIYRDIREHNLSADEARSVYYRSLNKEETLKINMLSRISPEMDIDSSIQKNLQDIRDREQFRIKLEIFRRESLNIIETTILSCIKSDKISVRILEETENSIEIIREDLLKTSKEYVLIFGSSIMKEPAIAYYNLLKEYARKGISNLLYLSEALYEKSLGNPLTFSTESMLNLCDVWLSTIKEYRFFYGQFLFSYQKNEQYISSLFKGKASARKNIQERDKIIRTLIIGQNPKKREKLLTDLVNQAFLMNSIKNNMRRKLNLLQSFYEESLKRSRDVYKYLAENICTEGKFHPRNRNTRMMFVSFAVILRNMKSELNDYQDDRLVYFGPGNMTYRDISYRLIVTLEILHSAYLQMANIAIAPAMAKEFGLFDSCTSVFINGKNKKVPLTVARDFCRNKLDELTDEIRIKRP